MTAIPLLQDEGRFGLPDPVIEITARIDRARARLRLERRGDERVRNRTAYAVFDDREFVGTIYESTGRPAFGPAEPTVLIIRQRLTSR